MEFTKTIKIREKIFSKDDVVALWTFVSQQSMNQSAGEATITIKNEGQDVSSSSDDIFKTSNFIKKPIKSIRMDYRSKDWTSRIEITVTIETSYLFVSSEVEIRGRSEEWVDACSEKIRDILEDVKKTNWLTPIVHKGGLIVLAVCLGALMWQCFAMAVVPFVKNCTDNIVVRVALVILYLVCACWLYFRIMKLDACFPVVDIDVSGSRREVRQKVAKVLWGILSIVIIPILIGLGINYLNQKGNGNGDKPTTTIVNSTNMVNISH